MQIPRSYIDNYSNALNTISEQARAALVDALSQLDYNGDVAEIRNAVIAIMQPACRASTAIAARLAAEFYDGLRTRFGVADGYSAKPESLRDQYATDGAVRAFVQDLVDDKPTDEFIGKCAERIDYETRRSANECVAYNAKHDPQRPKWARIPTGAETCDWCLTLASRGFAYLSEEAASHTHANCDCRVVPGWGNSPTVSGYDPKKLLTEEKRKEEKKPKQKPEQLSGANVVNVQNASTPNDVVKQLGKIANGETIVVSGVRTETKHGGIVAKKGGLSFDESNFFDSSCAVFESVKRPSGAPDYESSSGSKYWYRDGGVFRESDHWGSGVSTCNWFMTGRNEPVEITGGQYGFKAEHSLNDDRIYNGEAVGFCKFSDFSDNADVMPTTAYMNMDEATKAMAEKGYEYKNYEWYKNGKKLRGKAEDDARDLRSKIIEDSRSKVEYR